MNNKHKRIIFAVTTFLLSVPILYYAAIIDSNLIRREITNYSIKNIVVYVIRSPNSIKLFFCMWAISSLFAFYIIVIAKKNYKSDLIILTPDISIPVSAGQGQCGSAKFLDKNMYDEVFCNVELDIKTEECKYLIKNNLQDIEDVLDNLNEKEDYYETLNYSTNKKKEESRQALRTLKGGFVLGKKDLGNGKEKIYFIDSDTHTLTIGSTRCGKTRCLVIPSIVSLAFAGENIIVTDCKRELFDYCGQILKLLDYDVQVINFKNPKKSTRYNFLQPIINYVNKNNIPSAIEATWDLTVQLVGEAKGERIWNDGESSVIAAAIMAVVYDNKEAPQYQNLHNVYLFISEMCTPIEVNNKSILPLNNYVKDLPQDHPSKILLGVSEIAPSRTRGSFFTAALMTLRLFTNPLIAKMTSETDFVNITDKKTAIFIVLPEEKLTYHSIATLYVVQQYQLLSKAADKRGGRLIRRTNFILDEFGNFAKIPIFTNMLTVAGGKGIRFNLFLQGFSQLEKVYEKEDSVTIRSNCETWVYLQSDDLATLKEMSEKLDKYTISTYSLSENSGRYINTSTGNSISLTGRDLLTPGEIKKIRRPYSLITSRADPCIMLAPDLSKWNFNTLLGLGDPEENRLIRLARDIVLEEREVDNIAVWGIWDKYKNAIEEENKKAEEEKKAIAELAKMFTN